MHFYDHPLCNTKLKPAFGDEDNVAALPVTQGKVGDPPMFDVTRSYWVPTEAELILLNTGKYCIALTYLARTHAPVRLDVCDAQVDVHKLRAEHAEKDKIHVQTDQPGV